MTNVGLFGVIGATGHVSNLTLTNASITANPNAPPPGQFVGIVAGANAGTISNVGVTGTVTNGSVQNGVIAGGLVGQNGIFGPGSAFGAITNAHANVAVTVGNSTTGSQTNNAGGLVGSNPGTITLSDASGAISGGANSFIGGLVANNTGTISTSGATGNVTSTGGTGTAAGGLVAFNQSGGQITAASASGNVTGTSSAAMIGGLVAQNEGSITNSNVNGSSITGTASQAGGTRRQKQRVDCRLECDERQREWRVLLRGRTCRLEFRQHLGVDFVRHGEPANDQSLRSVRRPCRPQ